MAGARFAVDLHWDDEPTGAPADGRRVAFSRTGLDQAEFLVAPNPGEGLKPLAKIASGGETSRLMLGLKGVLARADQTPTLIFDEIDQGIGGGGGGGGGGEVWGAADLHHGRPADRRRAPGGAGPDARRQWRGQSAERRRAHWRGGKGEDRVSRAGHDA